MIHATETGPAGGSIWPSLPLDAWRDTCATLHMYTQIVGKIRLALSPMTNQWWQVALYLTTRGLTTSPMAHDARTFEIEFDFVDHNLLVRTSEGDTRALALIPRPVADFYGELMEILRALGLDTRIQLRPVEVPDPIPFPEDRRHAAYDAAYVERWWHILARLDIVFKAFRARFTGKCSPVHFFWGSFDLAVTRFSGRRAAVPEPTDPITREAYNEEVSSLGFWPGGGAVPGPAIYSYTVPAPPSLAEAPVRPREAFYSRELNEFILMYEDARRAPDPEQSILDFAQSTYEAGARLAGWDRAALERPGSAAA